MHTVKSLEDTFIYRHLNRGNGISGAIHKSLTEGRVLTKENIEEAYLTMSKNFKFPLKYKVLDAFSKGEIVLLYAPQDVRIPTSLPFFLTKNAQGKVVAVVLVDLYGSMNDKGDVTIEPKKLYTMMEAAYMALLYYHYHYSMSKRNVVITSGSTIYANMISRVLNKRYALNTDRSKAAKVTFLASKFFMINLLQMKDGDIVTNYAMKNCLNGNPILLRELDEAVPAEAYKSFDAFIAVLADRKYGIGLEGLTTRAYMEQFINMYDASTLLGLEHYAYFMYTITAVLNGAYLNHQYILEDITEKDGVKLYNDMVRLEQN